MDHAHEAPPRLDEPKTPLPFTLLGLALLLIGATVWIARTPDEEVSTEGAPQPAEPAEPAH